MNSEHLETPDHKLHITFSRDLGWTVWLNTEVADFDGLCIGAGQTRDEAVSNAVGALEAAVDVLQQPPSTKEHDQP